MHLLVISLGSQSSQLTAIQEAREVMGWKPKFELANAPITKSGCNSKRKPSTVTFTSSKRRQLVCKNLTVFQYMGPNAPSEVYTNKWNAEI